MNIQKVEVNDDFIFGERDSRWYQIAAVNGVAQGFEQNKVARIILKAPTGTGKTHMCGLIMTSVQVREALGVKDRPLRVLYIAHMNHLLTQAFRAYADESRVHVIDPSGKTKTPKDATVEIYYHSAFSEVPDFDVPFDLIVIDEGHHEPMMTLQRLHDKHGDIAILLMTATDSRLDGMIIKADYIVEPITRKQAEEEGYLAKTFLKSFIDGSGRDKSKIICDIYDEFHADLGQTIMYVRTKAEMRKIVAHIEASGHGYNVVGLDAQPDKEIRAILDSFSTGKINIIVNCNKLSEGIDVKMCKSVFIGRQLQSYVLLNQIIGRAARPDCDAFVWELINPLSSDNLDTTVITGTPEQHIIYYHERAVWHQLSFTESDESDYVEAA